MAASEPINAWRALRDAGIEAWLLHSAGAHPEAQQSILAFDWTGHLELQNRQARVDGGAWSSDVPATMRQFIAAHQIEGAFGPAIVGWLGFGAAAIFEPSLPVSEELDGEWFACQTRIVFDEAGRHIYGNPKRIAHIAAVLDGAPETGSDAPQPATDVQWHTSMDEDQFCSATERVRDLILDGDLFQANIATQFQAEIALDPADVLTTLEHVNPSPYMAIAPTQIGIIASGSPELLVACDNHVVRTRPIAGTRRRDDDPDKDAANEAELLADSKERAEHMMLVDLLRNDVARVAQPGTTRVTEAMSVERYSHVMHMVSRVEGDVRPGTDVVDWLAATFPGGTVTGAPKLRATQRILEAEPVPRGPYTGSLGWIGHDGTTAWNILIRTLVLDEATASVHAGAGIVADSVPAREWRESRSKAQALLDAATGRSVGGNKTRLGELSTHGTWIPPAPPKQFPDARVLLIDNQDSFVYNLADYCAALGATTQVVRNHCDIEAVRRAFKPTHTILSPGPGWPSQSGATLDACIWTDIPVLGVCLGHQALAEVHGGTLALNPPRHGMTDAIHHTGEGLFAKLDHPMTVARYHSIHVATPPPGWQVDATLGEDAMMMAIRDAGSPRFGVQFHPESLGTVGGMQLLANFLEVNHARVA